MGGNERDDPLHAACASDSLDALKALIAQGHDAHAIDKGGRSLLRIAVASATLEMIEYLVEDVGLDVCAVDQARESLLHVAVGRGDVRTVAYLIKKGASDAPFVRCPNRSPWGTASQKLDKCPEDLVVVAARHGGLEMVEYLVENGFPIDPSNLHQRPLLEVAIRSRDVKLVDSITRSGVDLTATNADGTSMLCVAAKYGGLSIVEYLVNKGLWEDTQLLVSAAVEGDQLDVIKYFAAMRVNLHTSDRVSRKNLLHGAVEHASMSMIEFLVDKDVDLTAETCDGITLIHTAVERGDLTILNYLISVRSDLKPLLKDARSSLLSVRSGDVAMAKYVLGNGAPLKAIDKHGYSLVHLAVWRDSIPLLMLLEARGLQIKDFDSEEKPLLRLAVGHASTTLIKYLVDKGLNIHSTDKTGRAYLVLDPDQSDLAEDEFITAALGQTLAIEEISGKFSLLHTAVQRGDISIIQYLVDQGLDVHQVDKMGRTLLHVAIGANVDVIALLLKFGVKTNVVDKQGLSALHCAVQAGREDTLKSLVAHGADICVQHPITPSLLSVAVKQRDLQMTKYLVNNGLTVESHEEGEDLLHLAVASRSKDLVGYLLGQGVKGVAKPKQERAQDPPLLHVAVANQDGSMVDFLIGHGFDIQEVDGYGNSALHVALRHQASPFTSNVKLISYLCGQKLDINGVGKRGNTPLHVACVVGDRASAKFLLENGARASLTIQNEDGYTPLHLAAHYWDSALVKVLLECGADVKSLSKTGMTPLGTALSSKRLPLDRSSLERLYSTARELCNGGASWSADCEEALAVWPQLMHAQFEKQWSKDSTWSSGKDSEADSYAASDIDPQDQLQLLERELDDALSVKRGVRACVFLWSSEHLQGRNPLTQVPLQVLARGEAIVATYLAGLVKSDASQLLYRRKICVAGPTKWGKTSLVKSVTSSRSQHVPGGDRTIGIDLFSCYFVEERDDVIKCHDVTFWDFAGQDGYQVVHSVFFSRQTLYLICVDLDVYAKSLASGVKETRSNRQSEAALSRFVGRSVFSWIRLIFARQPDAEMVFVGTKADMLKDSKQLEEVKQDLQVRLSAWKRKLEKEIDAASMVFGNDESTQPLVAGFGDGLHSARIAEKLKAQVTMLLSSEWLVVSTVDENAVDQAWDALAERITSSNRCFVLPDMHSRVLTAIRTKQASALRLLSGKDRVESCVVPITALSKILLGEIDGLGVEECTHILRTLHDMGDILYFEDAHVGPLQDMVVLDPLLVIDLVREVINHEQMDGRGFVADDGRVPHEMLMQCHLWKDMDSELVFAFKLLLQFYQIAYPTDGKAMDWDSDLIVPSYWGAQREPIHAKPLLEQKSSIQRRGIQTAVFLCWDYELSAEVSEVLFEQFAVESHTPLFERQAWQNCIESFVKGEFASRLELSPGQLNFDSIRIEVAAEEEVVAWRYIRFYVMAMETVLDRYPGLLVSRYIVEVEGNERRRHRVNLAVRTTDDALRLGRDESSVHSAIPWIPTDFSWFVERAWREPGLLQRLRTRELVRQTVDKLDVLRRLVVSGDKHRRYPALWTVAYDEGDKTITLKILSDLTGICYHVPIEVSVPPSFLAEYGTWLQHGLSICSNVISKLLSIVVLQKVFEAAQPVLGAHVDRAKQVHNLIDSLDLDGTASTVTSVHKLLPGTAIRMLQQLLKLHDESFDELEVSKITNLECAATTDEGYFVWAHRYEILELQGRLELCSPVRTSPLLATGSVPPSTLPLRLTITAIKGLSPWDWRRVYCEWHIHYGEATTPIASGETKRHDDATAEPAWADASFTVPCVASITMLRECRLIVQIKRPSRFLGTIKTIDNGTVWLRDFVTTAAAGSLHCDPITVPLDTATPPRRAVSCHLLSV